MSSLSRVRRPTAAGFGGKIIRRRRSTPFSSPYRRRGGQSGGATWILGIVAGAGKLISSVFTSESPSPSTSYSYSTDYNSYDEDTDVSSQEPDELNLTERKLDPVKDCYGTSLGIISEIKSKHAIEQLIMQETFTRDEGKKLVNIIESRVVEVGNGGTEKELFDRTTCNAGASLGTSNSLNLSRKLPSILNAFASRSSAFQELTPELHNSANMQAKEWLEDKMLASSSKVNFDSRPFSLNTTMLQYDIRGKEGSPVDVAKSYMRSLSPWKTSSWSSIGLEKSPYTGIHFYKDSTTLDFSVPSSKGLKRNYPALGLQDKVDEIRRVRLKSTDDLADSKCKPIDASERYSGDEACKISSVDDELIHLNLNKLSDNAISDTEEVVNATRSTHEASLPATLPFLFCDPAVPISEENQLMEQLDRLSGPCASLIATPASVEHAGNHVDTLTIEDQTLPPVDVNFTPSDAEAATRLNDFNTSSIQLSSRVENSSSHQKPVSVVKEMHLVAESTQHDGMDQTLDEPTDLRTADGLAELNTNVAAALTEDLDATVLTYIHATKTNNSIGAKSRSRGGSRVKSVKDVSKQPESGSIRGRRRKSMLGARRGRGK